MNDKYDENGLGQGSQPAGLSDLLLLLRRRLRWAILVATLTVVGTAAYAYLQAPIYRARSTLRVEEQRSAAVPVLDLLADLARGAQIETEMEIVRSRQVAEYVVSGLGLQARVNAPRGVFREDLFSEISVSRSAEPGTYSVRFQSAGVELSGPEGERTSDYGQLVQLGPLTMKTRGDIPAFELPKKLPLEIVTFAEAVEELQEDLGISRPQRDATILSVTYESKDPALARDVVNAVTTHFLVFRNQMEKQQARATVRFLRSQVDTIEHQLTEAESQLRAFRQENLLLHPETQVSEDVRRLAELQARRAELEVERSALQQLLEATRQPPAAASPTSWARLASFPTFLGNDAIATMLEQLTQLETELSRLENRRTQEDPDVQNLQRTIHLLEERLASLANSYLAALDQQIASLDTTLSRFDQQLLRVPAVEVEYARLRRTTDVLGELYTYLQTRLKEAEVAEAVEIASIQVVDPAVRPFQPVRPRKLVLLTLGVLLGAVLGFATAVVAESVDTKIRSREELTRITGAPILAVIPKIQPTNGRSADAELRIERRLVTRHSPKSSAAEAYRSLRTNLTFSAAGRNASVRRIVFTSPEPQDGKTTTAANAAIILAEQGHATLLVDCDLRRPMLHSVFHKPRSPGLAEILVGLATLAQTASRLPMPEHFLGTLEVVPAGTGPPNPSELLGSDPMRSFLEEASSRYDMVVMDTPPINVVTDAAILAMESDAVVIVTRQGATHRDALRAACENLRHVNANVVGTVLNDSDPLIDRYGYRGAYRHYYEGDADQ